MTEPSITVVSPGQKIQKMLSERGWSQQDLATIMGRPLQAVNEIIRGSKQITAETALQLSQALGTDPLEWMKAEALYRLSLASKKVLDEHVSLRAKIYGSAPIREITRLGWIKTQSDLELLAKEVLCFLGAQDFDSHQPIVASFRRGAAGRSDPIALTAWVRRVRILAEQQRTPAFNPEVLNSVKAQLSELMVHPNDVSKVPEVLISAGIRFVVVPHLSHTFADGAAFWIGDTPVVALTLRYDRVDSFWFSLMHELAHIERAHDGLLIDEDINAGSTAENRREVEADRMAAHTLLPQLKYEAFVIGCRGRFAQSRVELFASEVSRHPGIVVGRLQRDGILPYSHLRSLLVPVRQHLTGWWDRVGTE
jgi:HTH-type transcriptional regulator/antitoxin HigA